MYAVFKEILSVLLFLFPHKIIIIVEVICLNRWSVSILRLFLFLLSYFLEQITQFLVKSRFLIWFLRNRFLKMRAFLWIEFFCNITLVDKVSFSFFKFIFKLLKIFLIILYNWILMSFSMRIRHKFIAVLKFFDNLLSSCLGLFLLWPIENRFNLLSNVKTFFL